MDGERRRIFLRAGGFNQRIEQVGSPNLRSPTHEASASRSLEGLKLVFTFCGGRGNNTIGRKAEWRPVSVTVRQDSLRCRKILGTERQSQPWTALSSPGRSRARRCGTRPASGQVKLQQDDLRGFLGGDRLSAQQASHSGHQRLTGQTHSSCVADRQADSATGREKSAASAPQFGGSLIS